MSCLSSEISSRKECGSVHKSELIDLSKYRLDKAHDMLKAALRDMDNGDYGDSLLASHDFSG